MGDPNENDVTAPRLPHLSVQRNPCSIKKEAEIIFQLPQLAHMSGVLAVIASGN